MNYYPFHIGDYAAHTQRLSLMEDLAYRRLMDAYYLAERPLSGSSSDIARDIGMLEQLESVKYVLSKFFEATDGGFSNARCDKEIAHFNDKKTKASNAGKTSAQRRLSKKATDVEKVATDVQPTNNQEPITNNQEIPPNPPEGGDVAIKDKPPEPIPELPEFVDRELWDAWVQCRKGKRISALSAKIAIGQLSDWNSAGLDANSALRNAVIGGWQGLFKPDKVQKKEVQSQSENSRPQWAIDAGFANVWEANNARCYQRNAHEFRNGEKVRGLVL